MLNAHPFVEENKTAERSISFNGLIIKQVKLLNHNVLIPSVKNIFACLGLINEIGRERMYSFYSRQ